MRVATLQLQSLLRTTDRRINPSREPKKAVRNPSSPAPATEVAISLEAKKRHIIDQIVDLVVREITHEAVPDAPGKEETAEPAPARI